MLPGFEKIIDDAVELLHELVTEDGILASSVKADNYHRIWARDSMVCGLAGILLEDDHILSGMRNSLLTLAASQHELGQIPSNVDPVSEEVSFGSLAGRIDASTWFIIGACLYYLETDDEQTWQSLKPAIEKCRRYLQATEFNSRGWLYTPLSGNWADEYPVHGYTLYDNALRIWGEKLWLHISGKQSSGIERLQQKTETNFWPLANGDRPMIYQKEPFEVAMRSNPRHFICFILPGMYDTRFDAAGNGLMMLLTELSTLQQEALSNFLNDLKTQLKTKLIPAFWPVIDEQSYDWYLLKGNYSFNFKNKPGYFHNGGIWPVWAGLFCLGLTKNGLLAEAEECAYSLFSAIEGQENWDFQEYLNAGNGNADGKNRMGYSASGVVFAHSALSNTNFTKKLRL